MIEFRNVAYSYPAAEKKALKNINLKINKGEFVALIGENGSGKTTLCKCINGIIPHSERGCLSGQVLVKGRSTAELPTAGLAREVGIVLEDPETQLFTTSVANEIAFGAENLNLPPQEILKRMEWALHLVRLEGLEKQAPSTLSGGQKQRLAIAAALVMKPDIMVLDEPSSQLDPLGTEELFQVIKELKNRYGMTIVMASHKMEELIRFADKVCVLQEGEILAFESPESIFTNKTLFENLQLDMPHGFKLANYLEAHRISIKNCRTIQESKEAIKKLLSRDSPEHE